MVLYHQKENIIEIKMRTKRFKEYIKEGYEAVPEDYEYFKRMVIDPEKSDEENKLHKNIKINIY